MDDITNARFRALDERLDALDAKIDGMEGRLAARLQNVAMGFNVALDAAGAAIRSHIDVRFTETMRKFQGQQQ